MPEIGPTREHAKWRGVKSQPWTEEIIRSQDAVVIATNHKVYALHQLADWANLVVDTRNAM